MKVHKEGKTPLINIFIILLLINIITIYFFSDTIFSKTTFIISLILFATSVNFFKSPERIYEGHLYRFFQDSYRSLLMLQIELMIL